MIAAVARSGFARARPASTCGTATSCRLLGAYCLCWCLYGVGFYLASTSVCLTGSGSPSQGPVGLNHLPEMIGINALSWTVGFVSIITPAGLGVREGVAFSLLSKILAEALSFPYPAGGKGLGHDCGTGIHRDCGRGKG